MKENGVQSSTESSTISYSNVVIPEGITNYMGKKRLSQTIEETGYCKAPAFLVDPAISRLLNLAYVVLLSAF